AASIGTLLKHSGIQVGMLKIDPYINVDPGTMSPLEHGEVFVTKDGAETDLDIGNYERFLDTSYLKSSNFTTGQVYSSVIERERAGGYLGQTIQVIPHIVGEIVKRIKEAGEGHEILIVELGGTVGDIEGLPFMEAIRQMKHDDEVEGTFFVHVTLIPFIKAAGELKSKPTQHSVQELRRIGITPQMIIARSENALPKTFKKKLAMSCDVSGDSVIEALDAASIYDIPMSFLRQNILKPISKELGLGELNPDMEKWDSLVKKIVQPKNRIVLGFVGKYLELKEAYKSLTEALIHAGAHLDTRVEIHWVDSEEVEARSAEALLSDCDSILVAGGFGSRGVEGKIKAIEYARVNKIPYLGICLGMQLTLVEFARNVLGFEGANSVEFDENTPYPMIYLIDNFLDQSGNTQLRTHKSPMGGTLRLGEYPCDTLEGSIIRKAYGGAKTIYERHRHRYEANPTYRKQLEDAGMIVTGESNGLIEAVEIKDHPWFLGVQFHPEFTSRLQSPNPSILAFVTATLNISQKE
ncbi:MAG: CTP synthase, partial [Sulfurimonas sp. RIFOXYD2_FULL_37_8]